MKQKQHAVNELSHVYHVIDVVSSVLIGNTPGPCVTLFLVLCKFCVRAGLL